MTLLEKDQKHIWHPFTSLQNAGEPLLIESGEGVYLHTKDGRKIIDAVSSWWVNIHGHSNTVIAKAIYEQATKLEHVIFAGFTHEPAITLAENLLTILPGNQSKTFFSDNGSTAVEVGLKMAIQYWHNQGITTRKKIIALDGAYHGDTFGAMSVGERGLFTAPFNPYLFQVEFIDFPSKENEAKVIEQFTTIAQSGEVAAFIYEPLVQGAAGMRMYQPAVLNQLMNIARQHNILCIADEVFTGFGRTGKLFASEYLNHPPDIMAVSKGITGGFLPLGVTSCSAQVLSAFQSDEASKTFFHGHSYTANPISCAAANASFSILTHNNCRQQIAMITQQHQQFAESIKSHHAIHEVRALGTIIAIELKTESGTSYTHPLRKKIYPHFLSKGILLRPLGNVIYILPPYVITKDDLQYIYQQIKDFISEL